MSTQSIRRVKKGWWRELAIAALILLPLFALGGVYAQRLLTGAPVLPEAAPSRQPEVASVPISPEIGWLSARLERIGSAFPGKLGIAVVDVTAGAHAGFREDTMLPQQSVSKLWVAIAALEQVDRGELNLADTGTVRFEDLTLFHQPLRKQVLARGRFVASYDDFIRRALTESDNTANDMVLRRVGGPDAVRDVLEAKGLEGIRFGPGERAMQAQIAAMDWDQRYSVGKAFFDARKTVPHNLRRAAFDAYVDDPVDGATALAVAEALACLSRGELLSEASTARLLGYLAEVKSGPNRLKAAVPEGWSIAHKTGTGQVLDTVPDGVIGEQAGYNDVGILTAPDGRTYAVAVMIGRTRAPVPDRMDMMHEVVAAVVQYHAMVSPKPA